MMQKMEPRVNICALTSTDITKDNFFLNLSFSTKRTSVIIICKYVQG